jgi:hypothetical protein
MRLGGASRAFASAQFACICDTEPIAFDNAEALMPNWAKELAWLRVGSTQNPYPYEVLDCRAACIALSRSIQRETGSAALANIEAVAAEPEEIHLPADALSSRCSIVVPAIDSTIDNSSRSAPAERWRVTTISGRILVRRRWTGQLIHIADFTAEDRGFLIEQIISDRQASQNTKDYALAEFDFILSSCIAKTNPAFPIPPQFDRNDMARIALYGWQTHGPLAQFGRLLHASQ